MNLVGDVQGVGNVLEAGIRSSPADAHADDAVVD
jgi:hypothetical protein